VSELRAFSNNLISFFLYIFILIDTLMSAMHYIVWPPTNLVLKKIHDKYLDFFFHAYLTIFVEVAESLC
jgi:hypothetical protein